jgi:hypothetical protein
VAGRQAAAGPSAAGLGRSRKGRGSDAGGGGIIGLAAAGAWSWSRWGGRVETRIVGIGMGLGEWVQSRLPRISSWAGLGLGQLG